MWLAILTGKPDKEDALRDLLIPAKDAFNLIGKVVLDCEETRPGNRWSGEEVAYRDLGTRPAPAH